MSSEDWKTQVFRENIVSKINDKILSTCDNVKIDAAQAENKIFQKATSREEYFAYIAKFILFVKEKNKNQNSIASTSQDTDITKEFIGEVQRKTIQKSVPVPTAEFSKLSTSSADSKRPMPTDLQKLQIHKNAIATAIHSQNIETFNEHMNRDLLLFGQYVSSKLSKIENEEVLVSLQQKILSLLN